MGGVISKGPIGVLEKETVGQSALLAKVEVIESVAVDVAKGQAVVGDNVESEVNWNAGAPVVGGTEQLFAVSLIVTQEVGGAVVEERGIAVREAGGFLVGKESDLFDAWSFENGCPVTEPFGVDLFSAFGGLTGGVEDDLSREIVSGRVNFEEFDSGLEDVGGLNGGEERLKGGDRIVLGGGGGRVAALDRKSVV